MDWYGTGKGLVWDGTERDGELDNLNQFAAE